MPDITTPLSLLIDRAVEDSIESIAKEGLVILRRVLDESGFMEDPILKDYIVTVDIFKDSFEYNIELDSKSVQELSKKKIDEQKAMRDEAGKVKNKDQAKKYVKTYGLDRFGGPSRIGGMSSAKSPARDARTHSTDARKPTKSMKDKRKNSGHRLVEHTINAVAPRSMRITDGKVSVKFRKETKKTVAKPFIMPSSEYDGIMAKFMDKINDLIERKFKPIITTLIENELS